MPDVLTGPAPSRSWNPMPPATPRRASGPSIAVTMAARSIRLSLRQVDAVFTALLLPVILMLVFVELFGGALDTGTKYVTYVVPGVILLCTAFGSASTAISVSQDLHGGIVDRLRSLDVSGPGFLAGHVAASIVRNAASTTLVVLVALAIGFRPHAGILDWVAVAGMLLAFVVAMSWIGAAIGLLVNSPEAASGATMIMLFLPYASSAFVPVKTMPHLIQGFAAHQPITPITETIRALLLGTPVGTHGWVALAWCAALGTAGVAACARLFQRRSQ
jgi:ABC-2 type transport system permease protein